MQKLSRAAPWMCTVVVVSTVPAIIMDDYKIVMALLVVATALSVILFVIERFGRK